MEIIWVMIPERPQSAQRRNKKDLREYQQRVREEAKKYFRTPFRDQITVELFFICERKKGQLLDLDNLTKPILDALKGIAFDDDSQVTPSPELFYFDQRVQTSASFLPPGDRMQKAHSNKKECIFIGVASCKV